MQDPLSFMYNIKVSKTEWYDIYSSIDLMNKQMESQANLNLEKEINVKKRKNRRNKGY